MIVTQAFNPESCHSSVGFMTNNSAFPGIAWSGAQQNGVYQIETTAGPQLIWTGDRWYPFQINTFMYQSPD